MRADLHPLRGTVLRALLLAPIAGLLGCDSADNDPAQQRVEKPVTVETQR